jgi:hypothetical protein
MGKVVCSTHDRPNDAAQSDGAALQASSRMPRMEFNPNRCTGPL